MYGYRIVKQVERRQKAMSKILKKTMVFFAAVFVLLGITVSQGFMLPGFLLVALYYIYGIFSQREYEYILEDGSLTVDVILGRRYRRTAHELGLSGMEVVAPSRHEKVAAYRKDGGGIRLPKYDYTSYDPRVPYYTMIAMEEGEKIKLLLDLDEELLRALKRGYPDKVFL